MSSINPVDIHEIEEAQSLAADRIHYERELEIGDLKWLMSNKRGRRFVHRLLDRAGVWRLSFNTNALTMAFSEGTRNEGLRLIAMLSEHCLDRYTEMLKEHQANE